jgi:hypothetical protein
MRPSILILALLFFLCTIAQAGPAIRPIAAPHDGMVGPKPDLVRLDNRLDLLDEGFEMGVPPAGWTIMTTGESYTWDQASGEANSGQASAWVQYGPQGSYQDEWLVTPALDTSALAGMFLQFYEAEAYWADWGYIHSIAVSTTVPDDPAAFTTVVSWTPADWVVQGWGVPVEVNLSAYAGNETVYVAFRYEGEYADDWYIDDVWIYEPSDHDVRAQALEPAGQILLAGEPVNPVFTVKNIGLNTESFPVNLTIDAGGIFYDETLEVADLASGDAIAVEFPAFTPESGNLYVLTGTTMLDGDEEPANDVITVTNECFSAPRTPLALLVTNWDCGPCVQANVALDQWYPGENGQSSLIRVHGWWPGNDDPIYLANVEQSTFLIEDTPTGSDYAPHLWVDNVVDAGSSGPTMPDFIDDRKNVASPLLVMAQYVQDPSQALVTVDVLDPLNPDGEYVLYVAVTEDNVEAMGSNGEPYHNQAFRWLYPGVEGQPIDTAIGQTTYVVELPLDEAWVFDELALVAYVQNVVDGKVQNSFNVMLSEGSVAIEPPDQPEELPQLATALRGAYPNPFNPKTTVTFSLDRAQHVRLVVYDVEGRRVSEIADGTFAAGEHGVPWTGKDLAGRELPSGTYMVQMVTADAVRTSKMTLVR